MGIEEGFGFSLINFLFYVAFFSGQFGKNPCFLSKNVIKFRLRKYHCFYSFFTGFYGKMQRKEL